MDSNFKLTLTVLELAKYLGIGRNKAYQLALSQDFPSIRVGKKILINREGLQTWLNKNCGLKL